MPDADTRSRPDRSTAVDYEASRPSVDAPLVPGEWTEYRCRRCGEHCINRADGEPTERELCLDCLALEAAEVVAEADRQGESGTDADDGASPLGAVRASLARVAARVGLR